MNESLIVALVGIGAGIAFLAATRFLGRKKQDVSVAQTDYFAGLSYYLAGDRDNALAKFLATVRKDTEYIDAYIKIGDILRDMGRGEQSVKIHRDLLVRLNLTSEQTLSIYRSLAQDYRSVKNYQQAIESVEKIFAIDKNHLWAAEFQMQLYEETGEWDKAVERINQNGRLSREDKKRFTAQYRLAQGLDLAQQGREHDARLRYREAIRENDRMLAPYLELVDSYMRDHRPKAAMTVLKKIANLKWAFPELIFDRLKLALYELGSFGDLEKYYTELMQNFPDSSDAQLGLAELYLKKGNLNRAITACSSALANDPDRLDVRLMLTDLYLRKGASEKASGLLAEAVTALVSRQRHYICTQCNHRTDRYFFRCPQCHAWESASRG